MGDPNRIYPSLIWEDMDDEQIDWSLPRVSSVRRVAKDASER